MSYYFATVFFFISTKFTLICKNLSLFEQGPMSTVEPLYNKVLCVQNDILEPSNSNIWCI